MDDDRPGCFGGDFEKCRQDLLLDFFLGFGLVVQAHFPQGHAMGQVLPNEGQVLVEAVRGEGPGVVAHGRINEVRETPGQLQGGPVGVEVHAHGHNPGNPRVPGPGQSPFHSLDFIQMGVSVDHGESCKMQLEGGG